MVFKTLVVSLAVMSDAHAYIDPGSGSLLLQMLAAGVVGAAFKFRNALAAVWLSIRSRWN